VAGEGGTRVPRGMAWGRRWEGSRDGGEEGRDVTDTTERVHFASKDKIVGAKYVLDASFVVKASLQRNVRLPTR